MVTYVRYLSVRIDRSLRMVSQVDHVIQLSRAPCAKLRSLLTSRLHTKTKIAIYNCYIRFRLTLRRTGLVCLKFGAALSKITSSAESSAADDSGNQMVRQK
ncbi:hypothetical protein EVAR_99564_1 [Eumeta japonica]|uniref:Uncharacterized protein n=1 Tax=Eumeta variegata TaxID=151549 RepID=A0A4C1YVV0_EUMVA|nr:hypothetical protein EVAR_99564_1 [Eumeta japonica]